MNVAQSTIAQSTHHSIERLNKTTQSTKRNVPGAAACCERVLSVCEVLLDFDGSRNLVTSLSISSCHAKYDTRYRTSWSLALCSKNNYQSSTVSFWCKLNNRQTDEHVYKQTSLTSTERLKQLHWLPLPCLMGGRHQPGRCIRPNAET